MIHRVTRLYRASYSGLSPASWWLAFVMLVNRCGTMVVPFMSLYLTQSRHYSIERAGIVIALFGAGAIAGGFLGGRLCSRFGFYPIQLLTLIGGGCMFMVLGQMQSYPMICITTFVLSVINESFRPANSIAIAHYSKPENRTRSYSLNRLAINMGWALGGTLGGFIAAHNYHLLFFIDGFTNIGAALLLWFFLKPVKDPVEGPRVKTPPNYDAYKDRNYLAFSFLTILYAFVFFQWFSTLPVYYRQVLHLSEEQIGLTMTVNGIMIGLLEMVLIYKLDGRRHPIQLIKWGTVMVAISVLIFNIVPSGHWLVGGMVLAMVSTFIVTFGEMLSMPFMNTFWVSRSTDVNRGSYAGLYTVSWATAQVLGPYVGSFVADHYGFTLLWWIIGGIALATALGFWALQYAVMKTQQS